MNDYMLTTMDNPYNPWTEYEDWYLWDQQHGYNLPGYLARVYDTINTDPTNLENMVAWGQATRDIVDHNIYGNIVLVKNPELDKLLPEEEEGYAEPDVVL